LLEPDFTGVQGHAAEANASMQESSS